MNDVSTLFEPSFIWSTRVCAEAARVALRDGKTLKERVEIYEREVAAALASREAVYGKECDLHYPSQRKTAASRGNGNARELRMPSCSYTVTALHKCLSFANAASARKWDLFTSNEALFWFELALSIDHRNIEALIGSATLYQYILSQPLWHNNLRIINGAFGKGIQLLRRARELDPHDATIYAAQGAIYSAVGKTDIADEYFEEAISLNSQYAPGHYFLNFNRLFTNPKNDPRPGIRKGIELAEQKKNIRQMAAAYYFSGFANTLYGEYDAAVHDSKESLKMNPGYGSAHLALIAAASLSKHPDTFRAVRSFRDRHSGFNADILNYMWSDRSRVRGYRELLSPILSAVKMRVLRN